VRIDKAVRRAAGKARLGAAGRGWAGTGKARQAWLVWCGPAGTGMAGKA